MNLPNSLRPVLAPLAVLAVAACSPAAEPVIAPPPASSAPVAQPATPQAFPTTPPPLGPAPTLRLPAPVRRTLSNGLEVVYVRHGSLPVVHATLVVPAGATADPPAARGLASLTAEMLDEGAGGRSALEISGALDLLGASLSTTTDWDAAFVNLHVLRARLPEALRIMADVVVRPDFPEAEVQRVRDERITELTRAGDRASTIAANAYNSLVFGSNHPYGRLPAVETTRSMDRSVLRSFHAARYRPAGSTLILVGAVDADELHPVLEQTLGGWAGSAPQAPTVPTPGHPARTTIYLVDKPGAAQSEIRIGHPGVARSHPDYYPLVVLNTLLGGSFTSRLNTSLREVHGFSYGASSSFQMRRDAGSFIAGAAVFTAKTDSAVAAFFDELERVRAEPATAQELERAKNYVALGLPRRFETTQGVATEIALLESLGLSLDLYGTYVQRILAVTPADVQRVAREYVQPGRSVVVVVGDRSQVERGLRALPVGTVEIRPLTDFVR